MQECNWNEQPIVAAMATIDHFLNKHRNRNTQHPNSKQA
jgi:hypothetical protein